MQQSTIDMATTPQFWLHSINDALGSLKADIVSGSVDCGTALTSLRQLYSKTPRHSIRTEHYSYLPKRNTGSAEYNIGLENKIRDLLTVLNTAEGVWQTLKRTFPEWETTHAAEAVSALRFDDLLPDVVDEFERMLAILSDPRGFMSDADKNSEPRETFRNERDRFIGARDKLFKWTIPSAHAVEAIESCTDEEKQERETQRRAETNDIAAQLERSLKAFQGLGGSWDEFASLHTDWETRWPKAAGRFDRWDDALPTQIEEIKRVMEGYRQACIDGHLPTPISSVTTASPKV